MVKQFTDKAYSKANREATQAWLNGWMGQIVHDVAAARGLDAQDVCKALNAAPLSADEAAQAGLITAPGHRSTATHTLFHSATSAANPATLVGKQVAELSNIDPAESKLKAAELSELKAGQEAVSAANSCGLPQMPALDSAAQPSSRSVYTPGTTQLVLHSASEQQDSAQVPAVSLTESSAVDACSKPLELADPKEPGSRASSLAELQKLQRNLRKDTGQHGDMTKLQRIQAIRKPLNRAMVVQVSPDKLQMKCCLTIPIGKYIQVHIGGMVGRLLSSFLCPSNGTANGSRSAIHYSAGSFCFCTLAVTKPVIAQGAHAPLHSTSQQHFSELLTHTHMTCMWFAYGRNMRGNRGRSRAA